MIDTTVNYCDRDQGSEIEFGSKTDVPYAISEPDLGIELF